MRKLWTMLAAAGMLSAALGMAAFAAPDYNVATPSDYTDDASGEQALTGGTWKKDSKGWRFYEDGETDYACDRWAEKDGKFAYVGADGYMCINELIQENSDFYFVGDDGYMLTNYWVNLKDENGKLYWSYFGENGKAYRFAKKTIDGKKFIFNDEGRLLRGFVNDNYEEINDQQDAVLDAVYYCGKPAATHYEDNAVFTGWLRYTDPMHTHEYDGVEEIWFFFKSNGRKAAGETRTINGRKRDFDKNGVHILGDLHVNYFPEKGDKSHRISEFYNSGAADALFEKPSQTMMKAYPEDKYTFQYWEDEAGNQYKIGDTITKSIDVYGVWKELGKEEEKQDDSKQGGTTPSGNTSGNSSNRNEISTNTVTYGTGGYVTTSSQSGLSVGNDVSGAYTSGRWQQSADGTWNFKDVSGKDYKDEWAYVFTPYSTNTEKARWFVFDENGKMRTGWFTDKDGRRYYLNPDPQKGVEGEMMTGWVEIEGLWYYFNPNPDGTRGSLVRSAARPE